MHRPSTRQRRFVILLLALLTFAIAYYGGNRYSAPPSTRISGVLLNPTPPFPDFQLRQQAGKPFGKPQLEDHWNLLLLDSGSDQGDASLHKLVQVHNRLADDPTLQQHTLFIYVPKRYSDTLAEKIGRLGNNFILLSGEPAELEPLFDQLGNLQARGDNLVLYLVDPDANIQALYTGELDAAAIANDFHSLLAQQR